MSQRTFHIKLNVCKDLSPKTDHFSRHRWYGGSENTKREEKRQESLSGKRNGFKAAASSPKLPADDLALSPTQVKNSQSSGERKKSWKMLIKETHLLHTLAFRERRRELSPASGMKNRREIHPVPILRSQLSKRGVRSAHKHGRCGVMNTVQPLHTRWMTTEVWSLCWWPWDGFPEEEGER